jgi:hypothetical protein
VGQEGLQLGGEEKLTSPNGVEEGLDADPVPSQKQPLWLLLPDGKGKDAIEPLHTAVAPLGISVEDYLGVRMAQESMPLQNQQAAQLLRVIELAVVYHVVVDALVEQLHGLPSALQIHHSQAGVEEAESLPLEDAPLVRSTPCHCLQHRLQDLPVFPGGAQNACNCAHNHHNPFQARYSLFRVPGSVNGGIYQGYLFFHGAA